MRNVIALSGRRSFPLICRAHAHVTKHMCVHEYATRCAHNYPHRIGPNVFVYERDVNFVCQNSNRFIARANSLRINGKTMPSRVFVFTQTKRQAPGCSSANPLTLFTAPHNPLRMWTNCVGVLCVGA